MSREKMSRTDSTWLTLNSADELWKRSKKSVFANLLAEIAMSLAVIADKMTEDDKKE